MTVLRRHGTTIALCVGAILLTALLLWDQDQVTTDEAADRKYQLFEAWRVDELAKVTITAGDRELRLTSSLDDDGSRNWSLEEGGTAVDVDEQAVGQYLVSLEFAAFERRIQGMDRQVLGLIAPRLVVQVEMGKLSYTLRLGKDAPSPPGAVYAELEGGSRGSQTYVVTKELHEALDVPAGALRSRNLVPYLSIELQSFELKGPQVSFTLARGGWGGRTAGAFLLTAAAPIGKVRASRRELDGWLRVLGGLEVDRFTELPAADDPAAHELVLTPLDQSKPTGRLVIGGRCEGGGTRIVRRQPRPAAGCLTDQVAESMLIPPEQLVDHRVVGTAGGDIVELEFSGEGITVDLARAQKGWHMRKPDDQPVGKGTMKPLVEGLGTAEGKLLPPAEVTDLGALGLAEPRAQVRILGLPERATTATATERSERIDVGTARDGVVHVRRLDDGAVLAITADTASFLLPRPSALRSTQIYDLPLSRIRSLTLDCDGKHQHLSRSPPGAWTLLEPKLESLGADLSLANSFADRLRKLEGLRWASEHPQPAQQLGQPWCIIKAVAASGIEGGETKEVTRQLRVVLGAEIQGGHYAQHDDADAVFVAPRTLGSLARQWLLDRAALMFDADDIDRLTLTGRGDRRLTIDKQGSRWVVKDNPSSQAGEVVKTGLEQLLAEGVDHLGAAGPQEGMDHPVLRIEVLLRSAPGEPVVLTVGSGEVFHNTSVFFVRRSGIDATFAVAQSRLRPLIDAL